MSGFLEHVRYALRSLMKSPGFTVLTVLILAIGIAGAAVMVALVQGVLVRPLPVRDEDRLIVAWKELRSSGYAHYSFGDDGIEEAARSSRLLESVAGVGTNGVSRSAVDDDGTTDYVSDALVTGGFFEVLGVKPILGRTLTRADDADGAERVVVISYALWQRRYHGSRDVIGRRFWGKEGFPIVGVMPPDLDYPRGVDIWRTTKSVGEGKFRDAAQMEVDLIGRLRPGVTREQAAGELAVLIRQLESQAPPDAPRGLLPVVRPFKDEVVGNVRLTMLALSAAVLLMLLIASANAANLVLMRNEARRTELAVRMALGAGRGRIVAQVLTESLVLAIAAGGTGLALTWWSLQPLVRLVPDGLPRVESVQVDWTVCLIAIGIALGTAAISGLAPALSISSDLVSHLRSAGRGVAGSASRALRRSFVVVQVALAVTIVAAAGLLTRTVLNLQSIDTGLAADRLVLVELSVPSADHANRVRHSQFLDTVVRQLEALPFVEAATPINMPPFSGTVGWSVPRIAAEGQTADEAATNPSTNFESIYPNYFRTVGASLATGRPFTDADREGAQKVVIISEDVARRTWPGQDPIGKRMKLGGPASEGDWLTVVGVAAPTRYRALTQATPMLYLPAAQFLVTAQMFAIRTAAPLDQVMSVAREHVRAANPRAHVMRVSSFASLMDAPLAAPTFNAFLLNLFGVVSLLLSAIGLYAVMSAYVRQRDRDIAVRRALGATTPDVQRLVFGEAVWLAGLGAAIGLGGAFGAARLVQGMLYGVDSLDPVTIVGAAGVLIAVSVLATYFPVRRATRIDPLVALRYE